MTGTFVNRDRIRQPGPLETSDMKAITDQPESIPGPPPRHALAREFMTFLEPMRLALRIRRLSAGPRGDGTPVLVIPGFGASDRSTWVLRKYLRSLGYVASGWQLGRNHGRVGELLPQVTRRVESIAARQGGRVHLVGWSLGGYLAREAAREIPEFVSRVITLGSPVVGGPKYTAASTSWSRHWATVQTCTPTRRGSRSILTTR